MVLVLSIIGLSALYICGVQVSVCLRVSNDNRLCAWTKIKSIMCPHVPSNNIPNIMCKRYIAIGQHAVTSCRCCPIKCIYSYFIGSCEFLLQILVCNRVSKCNQVIVLAHSASVMFRTGIGYSFRQNIRTRW